MASVWTDERKAQVKALFPDHSVVESTSSYNARDQPDNRIAFTDDGFDVAQMYEHVTVNFALLSSLADIFGTKEIDTDQDSSGGCESCDWGSNYEVHFIVKGAHEC